MATNDPLGTSPLTTILVVKDVNISKSFYVNSLGASLFREYGGNSVVLKFLDQWLLLVTPGGPTPDKPTTHFVAPKEIDQVSHSFTIRVENCQNTYQKLKNKGVPFITPPVKNGPETRCFFRDPDGHLFEISEYST